MTFIVDSNCLRQSCDLHGLTNKANNLFLSASLRLSSSISLLPLVRACLNRARTSSGRPVDSCTATTKLRTNIINCNNILAILLGNVYYRQGLYTRLDCYQYNVNLSGCHQLTVDSLFTSCSRERSVRGRQLYKLARCDRRIGKNIPQAVIRIQSNCSSMVPCL